MDKVILILGGNGFIGAECVETILNTFGDEYKLILVNRGNWDDWDTKSRIKSRIHDNIIFDRSCDKPEKLRESLGKYLSNEQFAFEAIIDFSGFKSKELSRILDAIPSEKIKVYIYISTDSVYEVSKLEKPLNSRLEEVDSIRPDSEEERKKLKKLDSYAHHKLKCEELLLERAKETKLPFVMLRLPDVLGERDSSHRFWQVQMQLEYLEYLKPNETHQIEISKPFYELKTSYVNVKDIAKSIVYFLKSNIRNEIFNIGFEQSLSLIEFYQVLAHSIKPGLEKRLEFKAVERHIYHPFPSVTKGPVSIEKIKTLTGFQPSNLESFFSECVAFYRDAFMKYPKMRLQVEKEVKKDLNIKSDESKEKFEEFIKNYKV